MKEEQLNRGLSKKDVGSAQVNLSSGMSLDAFAFRSFFFRGCKLYYGICLISVLVNNLILTYPKPQLTVNCGLALSLPWLSANLGHVTSERYCIFSVVRSYMLPPTKVTQRAFGNGATLAGLKEDRLD